MVALRPLLPTPLKEGVDSLRGYPDRLQRAALGPEAPRSAGWPPRRSTATIHGEAVLLVGALRVLPGVLSTSGEVAFEGGPPVGEIRTDALGAVPTVWVGNFTPLRAHERYRIDTWISNTASPPTIRPLQLREDQPLEVTSRINGLDGKFEIIRKASRYHLQFPIEI